MFGIENGNSKRVEIKCTQNIFFLNLSFVKRFEIEEENPATSLNTLIVYMITSRVQSRIIAIHQIVSITVIVIALKNYVGNYVSSIDLRKKRGKKTRMGHVNYA